MDCAEVGLLERIADGPPVRPEPIVRLSDYPRVAAAIESDGAIRMVDGRCRVGFVNMDDLQDCIVKRLLVVEVRDGIGFAVKPNIPICVNKAKQEES
jgi:hypothetical protein